MSLLRSVVAETLGLFVDDRAFAGLLVAWVGLFAALGRRLPPAVAAPLFFLGLAALALVFVVRQARRLRPQARDERLPSD